MKRHIIFEQLSQEHQQFLLVCWQIRQGVKNGIEIERIEKYLIYSLHHFLLPHFEYEENLLFSLLGEHHPFASDAMQEHELLKVLMDNGISSPMEAEKNLFDIRNTYSTRREANLPGN